MEVLKLEHAAAVLEILQASVANSPGQPHWSIEQIKSEILSQRSLAVWQAGQLAAFVLYRELGEDSQIYEISYLATAPAFRRTRMMSHLMHSWLRDLKQGYSVWLEVHEHNLAAQALYKHLGFRHQSIRAKYYPDGGAAVLLTFTAESRS